MSIALKAIVVVVESQWTRHDGFCGRALTGEHKEYLNLGK